MVKIYGDWNGMSCNVCARYKKEELSEGICESEGKQYENNLCKLFKPKGLSPELDEIWEFCQKKWILNIVVEELEGIACKSCRRFNSNDICDFKGKQNENHYCKLYIPKGLSFELGQMWGYYQRRWIIERQS